MQSEAGRGWTTVAYQDVAHVNQQSLGEAEDGDLWIRYLDLSSVVGPGLLAEPQPMRFGDAPSRARRVLNRGDTLVSCVRPYQRAFAFIDQQEVDLVGSTGFAVLTPKVGVCPEFLYQTVFRDEFVEHLKARMTGSGYPAVKSSDIAEATVPLPPLPEQRKIAEILGSVDEAIRATEAVIEQTRRVKEGLLQELLTKGIGHTKFKQTEIGEIPVGWSLSPLSGVLQGAPRNGLSPPTSPTGVPTFSIGAVREGRVNIFDNLKFANVSEENAGRFRVRKHDILLVRGNANPELVGSAGLVEDFPSGCIYPDLLMRLQPKSGFTSGWLLAAINDSGFHSRLLSKAKTTNGTLKVNGKDVQATVLAVPPRIEQDRIAEIAGDFHKVLQKRSSELRTLEQVKKGLLQDLLTGKVRVKP